MARDGTGSLTCLCAQLSLLLLITHFFIPSQRHQAALAREGSKEICHLCGSTVVPSLDGDKCCIGSPALIYSHSCPEIKARFWIGPDDTYPTSS